MNITRLRARAEGAGPRRQGQELSPGRARGRVEQEHGGRDRQTGTSRSRWIRTLH